MVRQLGQLFLQPIVDTMWLQLAGPGTLDADKPQLVITVQEPTLPGSGAPSPR